MAPKCVTFNAPYDGLFRWCYRTNPPCNTVYGSGRSGLVASGSRHHTRFLRVLFCQRDRSSGDASPFPTATTSLAIKEEEFKFIIICCNKLFVILPLVFFSRVRRKRWLPFNHYKSFQESSPLHVHQGTVGCTGINICRAFSVQSMQNINTMACGFKWYSPCTEKLGMSTTTTGLPRGS